MKLAQNPSISFKFNKFKTEYLFDPDHLEHRKSKAYQTEILEISRRILPQIDASEIANGLFKDDSFRTRWKKSIIQGISQHKNNKNFSEKNFENPNDPTSSLVAACVLNRKKPDIVEVYDEFKKINPSDHQVSRFTRSGGWNENTLHGALWYLYQGLPDRDCLLYSGFSRFHQMASPNMRYFQELCKVTFTLFEADNSNTDSLLVSGVSGAIQARAAKIASSELLEDVAKGGPLSQQLSKLINRLGHLFATAHKRRSQSEVEINHFTISNETRETMPSEIKKILQYGLMESVLYIENDTKNKSQTDVMTEDYILNPIFAPYFGISYRKKKKLTLDISKLLTLASGNDQPYRLLLKEYMSSWDIGDEEIPEQQGFNY